MKEGQRFWTVFPVDKDPPHTHCHLYYTKVNQWKLHILNLSLQDTLTNELWEPLLHTFIMQFHWSSSLHIKAWHIKWVWNPCFKFLLQRKPAGSICSVAAFLFFNRSFLSFLSKKATFKITCWWNSSWSVCYFYNQLTISVASPRSPASSDFCWLTLTFF